MKKKIVVIITGVVLLAAVAIGIFWYHHPTHVMYNDHFVIGNTRENIVERYGAFDEIGKNEQGEIIGGVYQIRDNTPELIMSYDDSLWYEIDFENDIAVRVRLREGYRGG